MKYSQHLGPQLIAASFCSTGASCPCSRSYPARADGGHVLLFIAELGKMGRVAAPHLAERSCMQTMPSEQKFQRDESQRESTQMHHETVLCWL